MRFWLALNKEERKQRMARQQKGRRWFWTLGVLVLGIQIAIAVTLTGSPEAISSALPPNDAQAVKNPAASGGASSKEKAPSEGVDLQTSGSHSPPPQAVGFSGFFHIEHRANTTPAAQAKSLRTTKTPTASPTPSPTKTATPSPTPTRQAPATGGQIEPAPKREQTSLTLSRPPAQIAEQSFVLAGTGLPGETIAIRYRNSIIAQTKVDTDRQWQVRIPTAPLERGPAAFWIAGSRSHETMIFETDFAPWWLEAPLRLQGKLGKGYACAPTVLGMAMDFYQQLNPDLSAPATIEIVQALKEQGFVEGYGADAQMLVDLSIAYGYSHSFFYREWSQAHLRRMLDAGQPVIANVRMDLSTDGYGHSVMVIGLSPDGARVMVNDPVQGMVEYAWQVFDTSWASFGPPYRHGLVVMP